MGDVRTKFSSKILVTLIQSHSFFRPYRKNCGIIIRKTSSPFLSNHFRFTFDSHPHEGLHITFTLQKLPIKENKTGTKVTF